VLQRAFDHWRELDEHLRWCDQQVGQHVRASPAAKRAAKIIGIGELGASALTAGVGDFKQFASGHQFGAWLGLVPRQDSSGGKTRLGRITKRGDDYLRTLLIQGAKAAVMSADKRDDPTSRWLVRLTARVGWQKACVAMANKNARILWAVMTREEGFDPKHVSFKPQAKQSAAQRAAAAPHSLATCAT
jgi:transposase